MGEIYAQAFKHMMKKNNVLAVIIFQKYFKFLSANEDCLLFWQCEMISVFPWNVKPLCSNEFPFDDVWNGTSISTIVAINNMEWTRLLFSFQNPPHPKSTPVFSWGNNSPPLWNLGERKTLRNYFLEQKIRCSVFLPWPWWWGQGWCIGQ